MRFEGRPIIGSDILTDFRFDDRSRIFYLEHMSSQIFHRTIRLVLIFVFIGTLSPVLEAKRSGRKAWKEIEKLIQDFEKDAANGVQDKEILAGRLVLVGYGLDEFIQEYSDDKHWWKARIITPGLKVGADELMGYPAGWSAAIAELDIILSDPNLPRKNRAEAEYSRITLLKRKLAGEGLSQMENSDLAASIVSFSRDHPKYKFAAQVHFDVGLLLMHSAPVQAAAAFEAATKSSNPRLANKAARELAVLPYRTSALDLEFVAFDGRKVNVADLKGKVVLIDFWATWCKPCTAVMPQVKSVYERYHSMGFEIVGISFDSSRSDLKNYIAEQDLAWAQYFDGRGWDSKIGERFSIRSIPTMWLLDKQGRVISTQVRGSNLERYLREALQGE